ncbi:MAG: cation:proton antiporter [Nanoarchaeota archaeon]|nr:cation:proton antiporter [Nanoarchaeota archaeon]
MELIILIIFLILSGSFLLRYIFEFLNLPKVLAPIFLGFIFQTFFSEYLTTSFDTIDFLASFGAIMLLFYIGLEVDLKKVREKGSETFSIAIAGFLLTFIIGIAVSYLVFHFSLLASFVIASVLSITAEGIAVLLLKENRLLKSNIGNMVISAGIIDDLIGIIILLFLSIFLSFQDFSYSFIGVTFIGIFVIITLFYFLKGTSKFIDSIFMKKSFLSNQIDLLTISVIFLLAFALFTETVHLDFTLGAILGGLILNLSLKKRKKIGQREEEAITLMISNITFGFLIYFFLFWIGTQFDLTNVSNNLLIGLLFAVIAFFGKFIGTLFATEHTKESLKTKFLVGTGLSSKGGVELVIATIGLKAGIINSEIFSSLIFMSVLLTILSPMLFNYFVRKEQW